MARSKSSGRWLQEHFSDPYVQRAQRDGARSRAVYKLQELDQRYQLLRPGMRVIDLGAAPGSWSQYAALRVKAGTKAKSLVIASDILPMQPIAGVTFIQGDFRETTVLTEIVQALNTQSADLVMSDMAPNITGIKAVDGPQAMYLLELAQQLAAQTLRSGGVFLGKCFHGPGIDDCLQQFRQDFDKVVIKKPKASRSRSREMYVLAKGFKRSNNLPGLNDTDCSQN